MIRRPPRSTLFPTRRSSDLPRRRRHRASLDRGDDRRARQRHGLPAQRRNGELVRHVHHPRSEEHTSELQSLAYLVCRLLLEKKKNLKKYSVAVIARTTGCHK